MLRPKAASPPSRAKRINDQPPIAVLGAGSWGTALAIQFARAGRPTRLWAHRADSVEAMQRVGRNDRYLPDVGFPSGLSVTADLEAAVEGADDVLVVVPSHAFRQTLAALHRVAPAPAGLVWATKGFELDTGLLPHRVVEQVFGAGLPTAVLSGPTFAREVAAGLPTAMTIASGNAAYARHLQESISTESLRPYTSSDIVGVEVGGATKNVYAVGAGLCDGLGFGANTRIALITRALAEITRLGVALGARQETFMGLAGIGDLVLTCTDDLSRNRRFGLALATGQSVEAALESIGQVVEGYNGARSAWLVATQQGIEMPILEQMYRVLHEGADPRAAATALMRRPLAAEHAALAR